MNSKEKIELAEKVAQSSGNSVETIIGIIDKIMESQQISGIKFDIDEDYLNKIIWARSVMKSIRED